jgi:hypothetical protein
MADAMTAPRSSPPNHGAQSTAMKTADQLKRTLKQSVIVYSCTAHRGRQGSVYTRARRTGYYDWHRTGLFYGTTRAACGVDTDVWLLS